MCVARLSNTLNLNTRVLVKLPLKRLHNSTGSASDESAFPYLRNFNHRICVIGVKQSTWRRFPKLLTNSRLSNTSCDFSKVLSCVAGPLQQQFQQFCPGRTALTHSPGSTNPSTYYFDGALTSQKRLRPLDLGRSFPSRCVTAVHSSRSFSHCGYLAKDKQSFRPFSGTSKNFSRMDHVNGYAGRKRKGSPENTFERPTKLFKPERPDMYNSDTSPDDQFTDGSESITNMLDAVAKPGENAKWQATLEQIMKKVVSIHFCQPCSFDTDQAAASEATGFVVDAEKGLILTNRHVVGSGPFWGYCLFENHEEVGFTHCFCF